MNMIKNNNIYYRFPILSCSSFGFTRLKNHLKSLDLVGSHTSVPLLYLINYLNKPHNYKISTITKKILYNSSYHIF